MDKGERVSVEVSVLEYVEGGNTIWIHGPEGGTVLRIKTRGTISTDDACVSPIAHADVVVSDDIRICVPNRRENSPEG